MRDRMRDMVRNGAEQVAERNTGGNESIDFLCDV
jgi:hypothetical protein